METPMMVLDLGNLKSKFISFGWSVVEINDGNSITTPTMILSLCDTAIETPNKG